MRSCFFFLVFFLVSIVALAAVRGDKGKYLVGDGGFKDFCRDGVSFSV